MGSQPAQYVFDQRWEEERRRLQGIEALWDEGSKSALAAAGVEEGWRCAEVGAGGGSMVEWLSDRVGPDGRVVATDVHMRFLEAIERDNVEIVESDVLADELPGAPFDLVYARLVVEHLGVGALEPMIEALRPGGLLVLEDYDFVSAACHPVDAAFDKVTGEVLELMAESGFDPGFGRTLPTVMRDAGLEEVEAAGRLRLVRGGTPETAFFRLTLLTLRVPLVDAGRLTDAEVDEALAGIDDESRTFLSPVMVAARGRRP